MDRSVDAPLTAKDKVLTVPSTHRFAPAAMTDAPPAMDTTDAGAANEETQKLPVVAPLDVSETEDPLITNDDATCVARATQLYADAETVDAPKNVMENAVPAPDTRQFDPDSARSAEFVTMIEEVEIVSSNWRFVELVIEADVMERTRSEAGQATRSMIPAEDMVEELIVKLPDAIVPT